MDQPSTSSSTTQSEPPVKFAKRRSNRDVQRCCSLCRQHGVMAKTRGHVCPRRECECQKCGLTRHRRSIMTSQIRLRREQQRQLEKKAEFVTQEDDDADSSVRPDDKKLAVYACQKCKNHGIVRSKKDHQKDCPFVSCNCQHCSLIDSRRKVELCMKECVAEESRSSARSSLPPPTTNTPTPQPTALQGQSSSMIEPTQFNAASTAALSSPIVAAPSLISFAAPFIPLPILRLQDTQPPFVPVTLPFPSFFSPLGDLNATYQQLIASAALPSSTLPSTSASMP